jgi:glycerophosphoryl diester phosphodiesterase
MVERTTNGNGAVHELLWVDINQLEAGSQFSAAFVGEPVPTLEAALRLVVEGNSTLIIEVKHPDLYPGLAQDLAIMIAQTEATPHVTVISFDHTWLADFHQTAPDIPLGFLAYWPARAPQPAPAEFIAVVWPSVLLDPTLLYRMHTAGLQVLIFTVDNPLLMRSLLWLGVDGIITNRPDVWTQVVE